MMDDKSLQEENQYLQDTLDYIRTEILKQQNILIFRKNELSSLMKEMYDETDHFTGDEGSLADMNQYLQSVKYKQASFTVSKRRFRKLQKMLESPYFGRIDFAEDGYDDTEEIYIGIGNITDLKSGEIYVYDWRAPISEIFYRSETGKASYKAPAGIISGNVSLKRQYSIRKSKLEYFFDSNITINDEILQQVLGGNTSQKMKNIVQTIQKEQDIVIRDTDNELLIVQGAAGSGKTSIALHRIAFLLYNGIKSGLTYKNFVIISPNAIFSNYISNVLPELGEQNVEQATFYDIITSYFKNRFTVETRNQQVEYMTKIKNENEFKLKQDAVKFKGSRTFLNIIDKFLCYYERRMIEFKDIYYDGSIIAQRDEIKQQFLNNKIKMPAAKRMSRIENMILERVHPLRKIRLKKMENFIKNYGDHELEIKPFSRLMAIKEVKPFMQLIHSFTVIDYFKIYKLLFRDNKLISKFGKGYDLPDNLDMIISETNENLKNNIISYEDAAPLLYIKLKTEGSEKNNQIKHVVIDEAQDYYPLQYELYKLLYKNARFTVLGDINQSIEKDNDLSVYDEIENVLGKKKTVKLFMKKCYRSSYEINEFTKHLINNSKDIISFERHETEPNVIYSETYESMLDGIVSKIQECYKQGFESIAVICKTRTEAGEVHSYLKNKINVQFVDETNIDMQNGAVVISAFMAKGLEFDCVIVFNTSDNNFSTEIDKNLLYISCTRALHDLSLYYTGKKSRFLNF